MSLDERVASIPVFSNTTLESTEAATRLNAGNNSITSITISAGGTGYQAGTLVFSAPPAGGTRAAGTYSVGSGIITGYVITNPGSGYTTAPTVTPSHAGNGDATLVAVRTAINDGIDTSQSANVTISATYTTGSGETSNNCDMTIYGFDGATWRKLSTTAISTGTATATPVIFRIAGASAATAYDAVFDANVTFMKIRIEALETGVATNKGTLTASVLVR